MSLKKRALGLLGSAVLVASMGAAPANAATPINGTGGGACHLAGTIKFKPALVNGGTAPSNVTVKAKFSSCSGGTGNGANITGGSVKGSLTTTSNDCASLAGTQPNVLTATAKWKVAKGAPKLNPSTITFTSTTGNVGATVSFDAAGSVTGGSFNGDNANAHANIQETLATIAASCGGKGVKLLHILSSSTATLS